VFVCVCVCVGGRFFFFTEFYRPRRTIQLIMCMSAALHFYFIAPSAAVSMCVKVQAECFVDAKKCSCAMNVLKID